MSVSARCKCTENTLQSECYPTTSKENLTVTEVWLKAQETAGEEAFSQDYSVKKNLVFLGVLHIASE